MGNRKGQAGRLDEWKRRGERKGQISREKVKKNKKLIKEQAEKYKASE
jgi:hypothetical protein